MKNDKKEKIIHGLDIVFASISIIALGLLYYSIQYTVLDVVDWLSNLEWYWYGLVFIITIAHPVMHLLKHLKKYL